MDSRRTSFLFVISVVLLDLVPSQDVGICTQETIGESICAGSPSFSHYQWYTCLSDAYIRLSSASRYSCVNATHTPYCYVPCMLEKYGVFTTTAIGSCACSGPTATPPPPEVQLPEECISPGEASCTWYDQCFKQAYECTSGQDGYVVDFAKEVCNFNETNSGLLASSGSSWLSDVTTCLQTSLVTLLRDYRGQLTCADVITEAYLHYRQCYIYIPTVSLCSVPCSDWLMIFWNLKVRLYSTKTHHEYLNILFSSMIQLLNECTINNTAILPSCTDAVGTSVLVFRLHMLTTDDLSTHVCASASGENPSLLISRQLSAAVADELSQTNSWNPDDVALFVHVPENAPQGSGFVTVDLFLADLVLVGVNDGQSSTPLTDVSSALAQTIRNKFEITLTDDGHEHVVVAQEISTCQDLVCTTSATLATCTGAGCSPSRDEPSVEQQACSVTLSTLPSPIRKSVGSVLCYDDEDYTHEQIHTCLSSAQTICATNWTLTCVNEYCWVPCMAERYGETSGVVKLDCRCNDSPTNPETTTRRNSANAAPITRGSYHSSILYLAFITLASVQVTSLT